MAEIVVPQVPGWHGVLSHHSAFVRAIQYVPVEPLIVEYNAGVVRAGVAGDATYQAVVLYVLVRHQWSEERQAWWSQANLTIAIVRPGTTERYRTGWKSETIYPTVANSRVPNKHEICAPLIEASVPRTTIQVIETPIEGEES